MSGKLTIINLFKIPKDVNYLKKRKQFIKVSLVLISFQLTIWLTIFH